jgi:hypothetical protein
MVKLWDPKSLAPAETVDQEALASALADVEF